MTTVRPRKTNFTAGEFDPTLNAREDTTFYGNAARKIENCIVQPQGGAVLRGGLPIMGKRRGALSEVDLSGATVTAPEGGTAGNATDGDDATVLTTSNNFAATDPFVIVHVDMGASFTTNVVAIDLVDYGVTDETDITLVIQSSDDDATWVTEGTVTGGASKSRRVAAAPGSNFGAHRYWRVARLGGAAVASTGFIAGLRLMSEGAVGSVRQIAYTVESGTEYVIAMSGRNADIWRVETRAHVASVDIPHGESDVSKIMFTQSRDTVLLFHKDYPPHRLLRSGSETEWDFRALVFDSVTEFAWGDEFVSGGENETQVLRTSSISTGNILRIELDGDITADITWAAAQADTATNIETALNALEGLSGISVSDLSATEYEIEFAGADGKRPWPILVATIITGSGTANIVRTNSGKEDTAPLWDANHGYPRCGTFYQGRLYMGGFRDRPDACVGSRAGSFFDFEQDEDDADDSPLFFAADTNERVLVFAMHPGRHLQIFTSSGEFFIPSEPIRPTTLAMKQTSRIGSEEGLVPFDVEGATLFVGRNGRAVYEYLFSDVEQSYQTILVSLLASHLVAEPASLAMRRRQSANDADLYFVANTGQDADGMEVPMAMVTILRSQQVTAFTRYTSPGAKVLDVTATQGGAIVMAVQRDVGGTTQEHFEIWDTTRILDGGARYDNPDFDHLTASGSAVFTYTFTSPADDDEIAVFTRATEFDEWARVDSTLYTVDLSAKTVTFDTAPASGTLVRVNKRVSSVTLDSAVDHLDGAAITVLLDGFEAGTSPITPASSAISLGVDRADFWVEYGFEPTVEIELLDEKIEVGEGNLYGRAMRFVDVNMEVYRTGGVSVGMSGKSLRKMPMKLIPITLDATIEEVLHTGVTRVKGLSGWSREPRLRIVRDAPMAFQILGLGYGVKI